jgi:hypothetical protein
MTQPGGAQSATAAAEPANSLVHGLEEWEMKDLKPCWRWVTGMLQPTSHGSSHAKLAEKHYVFGRPQ